MQSSRQLAILLISLLIKTQMTLTGPKREKNKTIIIIKYNKYRIGINRYNL